MKHDVCSVGVLDRVLLQKCSFRYLLNSFYLADLLLYSLAQLLIALLFTQLLTCLTLFFRQVYRIVSSSMYSYSALTSLYVALGYRIM